VQAVVKVDGSFAVARLFWQQIGVALIAKSQRVIQVVERRRLEGGAVADIGAPILVQAVAVGNRTGGFATELGVVVVTQVGLQAVRFVVTRPASECRINRSGIDPEITAAADLLIQPFKTEQESADTGFDVVLPGVLILIGAEQRGLNLVCRVS